MASSYQRNPELHRTLREQLRLFAFDSTQIPSSDVILRIQSELSKRDRLATLLEGELNFHGENSSYASHDLHAFAAKFPPQLPRAFIRGLTRPGDLVLDPMMGSGTTLVEAMIESRKGVGLDIDPLALRLCQVKTTPVDVNSMRTIGVNVISKAFRMASDENAVDQALSKLFNSRTKAFVDYWFPLTTQRQLTALALTIQEVEDNMIRHFLELTFSSIIVTKSGGVSKARDLAHSRPHIDKTKVPKDAIEQFTQKFRKNLSSISQLEQKGINAIPIEGNARCMPFADNVVDLIVTSPPYANAIDYMRAHKFSLVWFGESIEDLANLRSKYIGSERIGHIPYSTLPDKAEMIVRQLTDRDVNKAAILRKYFNEIRSVFTEMYRILRYDSVAIIVVGTSVMRGLDIQTHTCLADIASTLGFDVVGVVQRILDRNKRMMPARFGRKTDSMIEQRMHEEYVIGLLKPNNS